MKTKPKPKYVLTLAFWVKQHVTYHAPYTNVEVTDTILEALTSHELITVRGKWGSIGDMLRFIQLTDP